MSFETFSSNMRSQRKARVADDIKAFRERLRSTKARIPAAQARSRGGRGCGGEPSRMSDSATQQGYLPRRPLDKKIGDRPSTTDGVSPRQQVKRYRSRACTARNKRCAHGSISTYKDIGWSVRCSPKKIRPQPGMSVCLWEWRVTAR